MIIEIPVNINDSFWKIENKYDFSVIPSKIVGKEVIEYRVRNISISCNSKNVWTKKFRVFRVANGKVTGYGDTLDIDTLLEHFFDDFTFNLIGQKYYRTKKAAEHAMQSLE